MSLASQELRPVVDALIRAVDHEREKLRATEESDAAVLRGLLAPLARVTPPPPPRALQEARDREFRKWLISALDAEEQQTRKHEQDLSQHLSAVLDTMKGRHGEAAIFFDENFKLYQDLRSRSKTPGFDPLFLSISPLQASGSERHEVSYTKLLTYFLNPRKNPPLPGGGLPLRALLNVLKLRNPTHEGRMKIEPIDTSAAVRAEAVYSIPHAKRRKEGRKSARIDVVVDLPSIEQLIFIEAKVDASEGTGQTADDRRIAESIRNQQNKTTAVVFLRLDPASKDEADTELLHLTWLDVAAALTAASFLMPETPDRQFQQMFCSGILRSLYLLPSGKPQRDSEWRNRRIYGHYFQTVHRVGEILQPIRGF